MRHRAPLHFFLTAVLAVGAVLAGQAGPAYGDGGDALSTALKLPNASLLVEERGTTVLAYQPERPMVPASTLKLVTALAAIDRWGLNHRFRTDFYRDADGWLWVKGHGDPFLVSEELDAIARVLKARGITRLTGIGTDDSRFAPDIELAGRSASDNPYDAPVTALAANFNTVSLNRVGKAVLSGEPQTPVTPLARRLGAHLPPGMHRINLGNRAQALRYFAELLAAKLDATGIAVGSGQRNGTVPPGAVPVYRHENSRTLRHVLGAMLEYSTNFIANDLFLLLGDQGEGRPIHTEQARRAMTTWIHETFAWQGYRIEEGAGLSPDNRLSARQLMDAVKAFAPYRDLLPEHHAGVRAKTGTLSGVSCYAGFVRRKGHWEPFTLLINQPVAYTFRFDVARDLAGESKIEGLCPGKSC